MNKLNMSVNWPSKVRNLIGVGVYLVKWRLRPQVLTTCDLLNDTASSLILPHYFFLVLVPFTLLFKGILSYPVQELNAEMLL